MSLNRKQVEQHNSSSSAWIIIDTVVYDITNFAAMHPGGEQLILEYAGKDATEAFYSFHRQDVLSKYKKLIIGKIDGETPEIILDTPGSYSLDLRTWFAIHVAEEAEESELAEIPVSDDLMRNLGENGILAMFLGPGKHLQGFESTMFLKNIGSKFDYFHEMVVHEEFARLRAGSFLASISTGLIVGLPPVINFGKPHLRPVIQDILLGKKRICLAISEPVAGSDVANIRTTATKSADGKYYIVNGTKKWITGGCDAHYFTTAVVADDGISMLLIERGPGLQTRKIATSHGHSAGTALVIFENVKVPVENLLGEEGGGFQIIMFNFNHERWYIIAGCITGMRCIVEECFKWANQRKVFGRTLLQQSVIRFKLADMVSKVETIHSWLENITFQMTKMTPREASIKLGGPIALLKFRSTRVSHDLSDHACQIFGGRAITKTGMGKYIERYQRTYKIAAIPGGSEEIMADLGVRQAMRKFPNARL